eukprot:1588284-Amphidinium_carterae.1
MDRTRQHAAPIEVTKMVTEQENEKKPPKPLGGFSNSHIMCQRLCKAPALPYPPTISKESFFRCYDGASRDLP